MKLRLLAVVPLFWFGCGDDNGGAGASGGDAAMPDAGADAEMGASDIGDPCTRPMDPMCQMGNPSDAVTQGTCGAGERCIFPEQCSGGWPGGYCSKKCSTDNPSSPDCPAGSVCVDIGNQTRTYRCLKSCATHQDCRMPGTGYVCQPTKTGNVCEAGRICETPPASLPRGDWSANILVPGATTPTLSQFESEGNVAVDDLGHVAISEIGLFQGTGTRTSGSIMAAAVYDENAQSFHSPVAYGEYPSTAYTSDPVVSYDTAITVGGVHPLYLVWLNIDLDSTGNVSTLHTMVAKSVDNGATFGPPNGSTTAAVNTLGQEVSGGLAVFDKPWIAAYNNHVYVTYAGLTNPDEVMVVSDDGGVTWTAPRAMNHNTGFNNFGQIAIAKNTGDVFVTWLQSGLVAARWKRSANATWFEPEVSIPGSDNVANPSGNAITADGSHFWAAWDDATADGSNVKVSVAANAATATTLAFAATPVVVNDDASCGDHIHATVAVDASGIGHVLWLDDRYSGDVVQGVVHYAKSTDATGSAFTTPVVVSDMMFPFTTSRVPGLWLGDYIGIAVTASKVWATWADPRNGAPNNRTHFFIASRPLP